MIRLRSVSKEYERRTILSALDLQIDAGEFVFLTGPSGAGKTTLLRLLYAAERPTEGEVWVAGRRVDEMMGSRLPLLRRKIGVIFQDFKLLRRKTVLENITFVLRIHGVAPREAHRRAMKVLRRLGLQHRQAALPDALSGGEQQRVAIARAVAKAPDVLLCDEPTGALDFRTGILVLEVLRQVNRDLETTLAIITHNAAIGDMADRVVRMRSGRIVELTANEHPKEPSEIAW